MPFTTPASREKYPDSKALDYNLLQAGLSGQVGDKCMIFYRIMHRAWKAAPRWTTAHNLFKGLLDSTFDTPDDEAAAWLAWQVFFNLHVMPYEIKKREENGEVE